MTMASFCYDGWIDGLGWGMRSLNTWSGSEVVLLLCLFCWSMFSLSWFLSPFSLSLLLVTTVRPFLVLLHVFGGKREI